MFVGINRFLLVCLILSCIKIYFDKREIMTLNQSLGQKNQQLAHLQAVTKELSIHKDNVDKIAEDLIKRVEATSEESRSSLRKILKQPSPKGCTGAIDYLKNESGNIMFN